MPGTDGSFLYEPIAISLMRFGVNRMSRSTVRFPCSMRSASISDTLKLPHSVSWPRTKP